MALKEPMRVEIIRQTVARVPWWGCLALGLIGFVCLHALASLALGAPADQLQPSVVRSMVQGLATLSQVLIITAGMAAALSSVITRSQQREVVVSFDHSRAPDAVHEMSWREFTLLVGEGFVLQDYQLCFVCEKPAADGIDLIVGRDQKTYPVHCQQWKTLKVPTSVVKQFDDRTKMLHANGGFVVSSGVFTRSAEVFAEANQIRLIDGKKLFGMLQQAKASLQSQSEARTALRAAAQVSAAARQAAAPRAQARPIKAAAVVDPTASALRGSRRRP